MKKIELRKVNAEALPTMQAVSDKQREYAQNLRHAKAVKYNEYVDAYSEAATSEGTAKDQMQARVKALSEFDSFVLSEETITIDGENYDLCTAMKAIKRAAHKQTKAGTDEEEAYTAAVEKADEIAQDVFAYIESVLTSETLTASEYLDGKY